MSTLYGNSILNLVLGGGGIKGIAYAGVFTEAEKRRYKWGNIAGVSAGALAGSYLAAGYTAEEITDIMHKFDFSKIDILKNPTTIKLLAQQIKAACDAYISRKFATLITKNNKTNFLVR